MNSVLPTIFVSIASYRDPLCSTTITHLFEKAKYPRRIFVGICEQNHQDFSQESCFKTKETWSAYHSQVRYLSIPFFQAKGPTYARYFCSTLYRGEDFFFQIDSHSLFVADWDEHLVHMWTELHTTYHIEKPILSYYCDTYERYQQYEPFERLSIEEIPYDQSVMTTMTRLSKTSTGMIYFLGAEYLPPLAHPRRSPFISAQMFFCSGKALNELPFDPFLPDLFFGEEILWSLRCFTHGYSIFTPHRHILFHSYLREKESKYWSDLSINQVYSHEKVKYLLGITSEPPDAQLFFPSLSSITCQEMNRACQRDGPFGHGSVFSIQDYWTWIGLSLSKIQTLENEYRIPNVLLESSLLPIKETFVMTVHSMMEMEMEKQKDSTDMCLWSLRDVIRYVIFLIIMILVTVGYCRRHRHRHTSNYFIHK